MASFESKMAGEKVKTAPSSARRQEFTSKSRNVIIASRGMHLCSTSFDGGLKRFLLSIAGLWTGTVALIGCPNQVVEFRNVANIPPERRAVESRHPFRIDGMNLKMHGSVLRRFPNWRLDRRP